MPSLPSPDLKPSHAELLVALRFILAFYEPGQRHLDTEAWKHAEAGGHLAVLNAQKVS